MNYELWRAAYDDPEKAAKAAYDMAADRWKAMELYRVALAELVRLKDMKDKCDNHMMLPFHEAMQVPELRTYYQKHKPLAWQAARDALAPNG